MSPRAACRLDTLGFAQVYDYTAGKAEWLAYGLPTQGAHADRPRAAQFARVDIATCGLDDRMDAVRERVAASPFGFALVLSASGVLLGRVRRSALERGPAVLARDVMENGPSTVRPDVDAAELATRLSVWRAFACPGGGTWTGAAVQRFLDASMSRSVRS